MGVSQGVREMPRRRVIRGRGRGYGQSEEPLWLPTREELEARCAEVRAGWSERERLSRTRVDWRALPVFCRLASGVTLGFGTVERTDGSDV